MAIKCFWCIALTQTESCLVENLIMTKIPEIRSQIQKHIPRFHIPTMSLPKSILYMVEYSVLTKDIRI